MILMTTSASGMEKPTPRRASLPPGPPELPVIGKAFRFLRNPLHPMQDAAAYGDLATIAVNPARMILLNHPELVRQVFVTQHRHTGRSAYGESLKYALGEGLVTSDGELHLRQRRLMQPHFHRRRISGYGKVMIELSARHADSWHDDQRIDIADEMRNLTLRIAVKTLFGLDLPDDIERIGQAADFANRYMAMRGNLPPIARKAAHGLPLPATLRFRREMGFLDDIVYGLIEQRRRAAQESDDLLSLLVNSTTDDTDGKGQVSMSDQQLRDEAITLLSAGHETTATALAWTWHLLSRHPQWQDRWHRELDAVLEGRPAVVEDLPSLELTERIVTESMRLYPPIWATGRTVLQPFMLEGYEMPRGAVLLGVQFMMHRDSRWFENPGEFLPSRWTDDFKSQMPDYAFFPFGGGPRRCIGEGFAWMEAKLVMATLGQRWRVHADSKATIEPDPWITLRPRGGVPVRLERRNP